jgi:hypothetical protein
MIAPRQRSQILIPKRIGEKDEERDFWWLRKTFSFCSNNFFAIAVMLPIVPTTMPTKPKSPPVKMLSIDNNCTHHPR